MEFSNFSLFDTFADKKEKLRATMENNYSDDGFYDGSQSRKRLRLQQEKKEQFDTQESMARDTVKTFQDSVHGTITMDPLLVAIIDTPQFQRLRDIKQLGVGYWVYPGACHNRFEHCIGTSYLCGLMLSTLRHLHTNVYHDPIEITDKDILCVKIAGLCHDIGHGPFSHVFDGKIIRELQPESDWKHEDGSCDLFDHMIKVNTNLEGIFQKYGIHSNERDTIKRMIRGNVEDEEKTKYKGNMYVKQFLYEIVSTKSTGIDCDKFDYIARDTHHLGLKNSFDFKRFFQNIRIMPIDGKLRICPRDKEEFNLYELFHVRRTLHRQVYQHKTQSSIQEMLYEALKKADSVLGISDSIYDMERYTNMTDSVIYEILRSKDPAVKEAQEILVRIQTRKLFQFCGQMNPKFIEEADSSELRLSQHKLNEEELKEGVASYHSDIDPEDIYVNRSYYSFGKKDRNPLSEMFYFGKDGRLKRSQVTQSSSFLPKSFEEEYLRVFCKNSEKKKNIEKAFVMWCKDNGYRTSMETLEIDYVI